VTVAHHFAAGFAQSGRGGLLPRLLPLTVPKIRGGLQGGFPRPVSSWRRKPQKLYT